MLCAYDAMPGTSPRVGPFVAFSIDGPLDHSLIGVLAGLLEPLAEAGISILAESTFDTDWILVAAAQADQAVAVVDRGRSSDHRRGGSDERHARRPDSWPPAPRPG